MNRFSSLFLFLFSFVGMFIQANAQPGPCTADFNITSQNGLTIVFNNESLYDINTGNLPPVSWDFGDNSGSSDYDAIHTYTDAGVYLVCLTASDGLDCQSTFCDNVYVGTIACEDFVVDINTSGTSVFASIFDPSNSGPSFPDVLEWYIPGVAGNIGDQPNLTYTFPTGGLHTICIDYEIDGIFCQNNCYSFFLSDDLADCPQLQLTPNFTTYPSSSDLTLAFQNNSSATVNTNVYYIWDFGDNQISTLEEPVHTYANPGTYNVCLTMGYDGSIGCEQTVCVPYTVYDLAVCEIDFFVDWTGGFDYTFTSFPEPIPLTYYENEIWTIFDGNTILSTFTGDPADYTFPAVGTYEICLIADLEDDTGNLLCIVDACSTLTVVDPNVSCSFATDVVQTGQDVNLSIYNIEPAGPMPDILNWYVDGGQSLGSGPTVTFTNPPPGTYLICVDYEISGTGCLGTICQSIVIDDNNQDCVYVIEELVNGLTVDLALVNANSPDPDTVTWIWTDANTVIGTGPSISYTFPGPGVYNICADYELLSAGCDETSCKTITILPNDCIASFEVTPLSDFIFQFTDLSTGNYTDWEWNFGDGLFSNDPDPIHTYSNEAVYTVCLTIWDNATACQSSICQDVTVLNTNSSCDVEIDMSINGLDATFFAFNINDINNPFDDVIWDIFDDSGTAIANGFGNPTYSFIFPDDGIYEVCATGTNYNIDGTIACIDTDCQLYNINEINCDNILLNPGFSAPAVSPGLTVVFNNTSTSNQPDDSFYIWDFGDGAVSTEENPIYTYVNPGIYTVCLTMTYDADFVCQADPVCMDIAVWEPIGGCNGVLASQVDDNTGVFTVINVDNPNVPFDQVDWTVYFNGATVYSESSNSVFGYLFPTAGAYDVCADIINLDPITGQTCIQTLCDVVTITDPTNCDILFGLDFTTDLSAVIFSTPPPNGVSYSGIEWHVTDYDAVTVYTGDPATITFPGPGIYEVCALGDVYDMGGNLICQANSCEIVVVDEPNIDCSSSVTANINDADLEGFFELPAINASYLSWQNVNWVISSSVLTSGSTDNPLLYTFPGPDVYQVCLSADLVSSDGVTQCTFNWCESFNLGPLVCESIWEGDEHLVPGAQENEAIFYNLSQGVYPQVLWDFGDGNTSNSTADQLIHVYDNPGVYNVCLSIADPDNQDCSDTDCQLIFISGVNPCQFGLEILVNDSDILASVTDPNGNIPPVAEWYILETMTEIGSGSPIAYTFVEPGVYTVCTDIEVPGTSCMATLCDIVTINNEDCLILECVFPGDANYDQEANNFDLLNLGLAFGASGTNRLNASNQWYGQPSAAWNQTFNDGVDYKHADCNGDGQIDFNDLDPILLNYARTHDGIQPTNFADNPDVFLVFQIDTLNITSDIIDLEISADIFVGTQNMQASDLYGLAFTVAYPSDLVEEGSAEGEYAGEAWFGPSNNTLKLEYDLSQEGKLDFAYSRTDQMDISGFGQIATCKFVISDNLMGFNSIEEFLFNVSIIDIRAVDANGNEVLLDGQGDEFTILVDDTSTSIEDVLDNPIRIFPNPSSDQVHIEWLDAKGQIIRVFNTLGEVVREDILDDFRTSIQVSNLASGIYFISIQTKAGLITKRVMVE